MADNKPWIQIRSADGYRLAWLSNENAPTNQQDGQVGEHLDTGARFIYYRGAWHPQLASSALYYVSVVVQGIGAGAIYAANDAVGAVFGIAVPIRGIIEEAKLIDPDDDTLALTAHLFNRTFTGAADNAAFTISAADSRNWVTSITFDSPIVDIGSAKVSEKTGATYYEALGGFLHCQCSTTGTPTIAVGLMPILQLGIRMVA